MTELCVGSRLSGSETRFSLVFHVEGLVNDRIFTLLRDFGKATNGSFRPLLTCITPLCPMYHQDPWSDPLRLSLPAFRADQTVIADFASKINDLSAYYDIGYHGHFFRNSGGTYLPDFGREIVLDQVDREFILLGDLGFRPTAYAGGWWFIAPWLISKLEQLGFKVDTTLNDARKQYFDGPQPYEPTKLGEPFWISDGVLEVPSVRSVKRILTELLIDRRGCQNFVVLALHDYNLIEGKAAALLRTTTQTLMKHERVLSITEIIEQSRKWLRDKPREHPV